MKVYDLANELAEEIKQSEEYVTYQIAKQTINLNFELKQKIDEFEKSRYEAQIVALQTGKDDVEKLKRERIGFLNLNGLTSGQYRKLTTKEVKKMYALSLDNE